MKYDWSTREATLRIGAVLIASLLLFAAFNIFCMLTLPVEPELSLGIAVLGGFPLSIAAMCYAMLAESAVRAWTLLLLLSFVLAGVPLLTGTLL